MDRLDHPPREDDAPCATAGSTHPIEIHGTRLSLLPEKAILLPDHATLLVADVHIGKATSFRQLGVPVPRGTTAETLAALSQLVERWAIRRIVFLGDLLHSARALAPGTLHQVRQWRERHRALDLTLVRGNHDAHAGDPPAALGIAPCDEPLRLEGLALSHHPRPRPGSFVLAGHLHPCVSLYGRAHDRHRLPCYWFSDQVGVLPAFGAFTGMHPIRPLPADKVYAVAPDRVFELPAPSPRRRS